MELYTVNQNNIKEEANLVSSEEITNSNPINQNIETNVNDKFIAANTSIISLDEIKNKHIIPVFVKDNVPAISQVDFIESSVELTQSILNKSIANLAIRVSHPIKGRSFEARSKKASELLEHEKTIYNERMAFVFEIPFYKDTIDGKEVTLTVAGVKAYNQDNLYSFGGSIQRFKLAIGYKVKVCTNLCLFTDGTALEIKARNLDELQIAIIELLESRSYFSIISEVKAFTEYKLTENQFATLLGRLRMYNHLPIEQKNHIPSLIISDRQITTVAKEYFSNKSFMKNSDGSINLWNLYNLFTDSVKSSYIDTFLNKNVNAFTFTQGIKTAIEQKGNYQWFLS